MKRRALLVLSSLSIVTTASSITGCGGSGGSENTQSNEETTTAVLALQSSHRSTYAADAQALNRQLAAQGYLGSGNQLIAIANLFIQYVQQFLSAAQQYAATRSPGDRTAIRAALAGLEADDKTFGNNQLTNLGVLTGAQLTTYLAAFDLRIDSAYASAGI